MSDYRIKTGEAEIYDYTVGGMMQTFEYRVPLAKKDMEKALVQSLKENCEQHESIIDLIEALGWALDEVDCNVSGSSCYKNATATLKQAKAIKEDSCKQSKR